MEWPLDARRSLIAPPHYGVGKLLLDVVIAAVVFALSLALLAARDTGADTRGLDLLGVFLAALASLPLVARRRAPLAVFALTAAASATLNGLGYPPGPPLGPTVALYFLALSPEKTRASRWLTGGLVAGFYVIHAGAAGVADDEFPTVPLLFGALVWGGAWVIGDRVRQRRAQIAELEEQLRRSAREAERERRDGWRPWLSGVFTPSTPVSSASHRTSSRPCRSSSAPSSGAGHG